MENYKRGTSNASDDPRIQEEFDQIRHHNMQEAEACYPPLSVIFSSLELALIDLFKHCFSSLDMGFVHNVVVITASIVAYFLAV